MCHGRELDRLGWFCGLAARVNDWKTSSHHDDQGINSVEGSSIVLQLHRTNRSRASCIQEPMMARCSCSPKSGDGSIAGTRHEQSATSLQQHVKQLEQVVGSEKVPIGSEKVPVGSEKVPKKVGSEMVPSDPRRYRVGSEKVPKKVGSEMVPVRIREGPCTNGTPEEPAQRSTQGYKASRSIHTHKEAMRVSSSPKRQRKERASQGLSSC